MDFFLHLAKRINFVNLWFVLMSGSYLFFSPPPSLMKETNERKMAREVAKRRKGRRKPGRLGQKWKKNGFSGSLLMTIPRLSISSKHWTKRRIVWEPDNQGKEMKDRPTIGQRFHPHLVGGPTFHKKLIKGSPTRDGKVMETCLDGRLQLPKRLQHLLGL